MSRWRFSLPSRPRLRLFGIDVLVMAAIATVIALMVIVFGLYNVSARLGHLPGVDRVLHATYKNSVETWSAMDSVPGEKHPMPDLSQDFLIQRGAGHFQTTCFACHASPGRERSLVARSMLPRPPHITEAVKGWSDEQLYWILKHGVKMSGMPQWTSREREDEIWSVVAFLREVEGMTQAEYDRLVYAPLEKAPPQGAARIAGLQDRPGGGLSLCARCHGWDGRGRGTGAFPRLDIQDPAYLYASLEAYAAGERHSGIMQPIAEGLRPEEMRAYAAYYGSIRPEPVQSEDEPDARLLALGRKVVFGRGPTPDEGAEVPACAACHGPWPKARPATYPTLSGQWANYIEMQLHAFELGVRGGTDRSHLMDPVIHALDEEKMKAAAAFYAKRPPDEEPGGE